MLLFLGQGFFDSESLVRRQGEKQSWVWCTMAEEKRSTKYFQVIFIYLVCVACVSRNQRTQLLGVGLLKHASNPGHQAWWQGHLPAEPIHCQ